MEDDSDGRAPKPPPEAKAGGTERPPEALAPPLPVKSLRIGSCPRAVAISSAVRPRFSILAVAPGSRPAPGPSSSVMAMGSARASISAEAQVV